MKIAGCREDHISAVSGDEAFQEMLACDLIGPNGGCGHGPRASDAPAPALRDNSSDDGSAPEALLSHQSHGLALQQELCTPSSSIPASCLRARDNSFRGSTYKRASMPPIAGHNCGAGFKCDLARPLIMSGILSPQATLLLHVFRAEDKLHKKRL